ncbi:glycosyltransferase family 8 protein [Megasphaera coli]|uniref:glycosyltransferase family 8 protein n=1 Tax=Colibacter massiliensis TaxID=1852379 RepID=UPI00094EF95C|nr:glycosyltransferase family 8 protein [Colibacter massiliensis]
MAIKGNTIIPAFKQNNIVIILSSSDEFSIYLGVCIKSILLYASNQYNYDIIVLEREIADINKSNILKMIQDKRNVSIRFFNVTETMKGLNFYLNSTRLSQETYYGLLAPYVLSNFKRAIIMDCDMIAKHDLADLYFDDLGDKIIGGVNDIVLQGWLNDRQMNDTYYYYIDYLRITDPYKCFNGGLVLLDFEKYRDYVNVATIVEYINKYQLRVVDQDIFNILLEGKSKLIDFRWNHMICEGEVIEKAINDAPEDVRAAFQQSRKAPYIIHYAGDHKPWNNPFVEFGNDFWEVARQTAFYERILYKMVNKEVNDSILRHQAVHTAGLIRRVFNPYRINKLKNIVKLIFPVGTKRYYALRRMYFAIRGKTYRE